MASQSAGVVSVTKKTAGRRSLCSSSRDGAQATVKRCVMPEAIGEESPAKLTIIMAPAPVVSITPSQKIED